MHYGCGSRRAPREVLFSISFSCRYSIYISLLKTFVNILETFLKSFGKHQDWVTHLFPSSGRPTTKLLSPPSDHPMVKTFLLYDHPMVKTFPKPFLFRNPF